MVIYSEENPPGPVFLNSFRLLYAFLGIGQGRTSSGMRVL